MNLGQATSIIISYAGRILLSIIFYLIGKFIISRVVDFIDNKFQHKEVDISLHKFILTLMKFTLQVLLFVAMASMLGAEMTTFIAIIGSAGLAVGLALQGSLSNFAGGVLILLLKPFKSGDFIEAAGHAGVVQEIQVFYTILNTTDNKRVIIPNSSLSNSSAINYTANQTRRVDFKFGVGYEDDIFKVKEVLLRIANEHPLSLRDPEPVVVLSELGESSVYFSLRVWCKTEDYWTIHADIMDKVKVEFDNEGISIPFPRMDIHMK